MSNTDFFGNPIVPGQQAQQPGQQRNASLMGQVQVGMGNGITPGKRIVIAAVEKMGKTTLGCDAPGALLIPLEVDAVALERYPHTPILENIDQVFQLCEELLAMGAAGQLRPGQSLVWDSATALEKFIHTSVLMEDKGYVNAYDHATGVLKPNCKAVTMESALDGYGKAYSRANEKFSTWLRYQDQLAYKYGVNIIVTCHVFANRIQDPSNGEYDSWDLLLHSPKNNKTYGKREMITQWADMIGFLHEPMFVVKDEGSAMARGIVAGQGRAIAVDRTPSWVAGNRFGMSGVISIPLVGGWNAIANAVWQSTGGRVDLWKREAQQ